MILVVDGNETDIKKLHVIKNFKLGVISFCNEFSRDSENSPIEHEVTIKFKVTHDEVSKEDIFAELL